MSGLKVLVVEDDSFIRRLLELTLRVHGHSPSVAEDGAVAKEFVEAGEFDLVIVDFMMPVVDGLRFVRWLREEAHRSTPVLMLTASNYDGIQEEALAAGVTRTSPKPIDVNGLMAQVESLTRG